MAQVVKLVKLSFASEKGHTDDVKSLLAAGADPNSRSAVDDECEIEFKWTPLMFAANSGHEEIVKILLAAGADVTTTAADDGVTALDLALKNGHANVVRLLLPAAAPTARRRPAPKRRPLTRQLTTRVTRRCL